MDKQLEERLQNYPEWIDLVWVNSRGKKLSFKDRPYLRQIYEDQFHNIVYIKAAQCFPAGTLITTKYGTQPIEFIEEGTIVIGHDGLEHKVVSLFAKEYNGNLIEIKSDFSTIQCTPEHPFLKQDGYLRRFVEARELREGDYLTAPFIGGSGYKSTNIKSIKHKSFVGIVYNFEVEGSNSYIANNYAVHNCGLSERLLSESVWLCEQKGVVVLYVFPASSQLQDFTQARLDPVFQHSHYLNDVFRKSSEGVQKIELKKIGNGYLYFRGSQNEKQIISIDADCFDDKTEVYTNNGWKFFDNLDKTDTVATINDKNIIEFQKPTQYIKYHWSGELISIENQQVNFAVKPGHNLYARKQRTTNFELIKAQDLFGLDNITFKTGINEQSEILVSKDQWRRLDYDGNVYCVSVPNKTLYTRRNNVSTWSGNCVYLDERDRFLEKSVPFIDKRTLASSLRWRREASTPTLPGHGVHNSYQESDQRVWQVQCPKCKKWQEIDFFKNIDHKTFEVKCSKKGCTGELDRLSEGRWKALKPEVSKTCHGYKVSGLFNPRVTVEEMVNDYYKALGKSVSDITQFYNQTLGMPFQMDGQKLSSDNLDSCKRDYSMPVKIKGCFAGADVGSVINMVVNNAYSSEKTRVVWAGTVNKFFGPTDSVESIMKKFDIKMLIIDKFPEQRKVSELIDKFPGRVYAADYPTKKFTVDNYIMWDDPVKEVKLDRTISLDYLVSDIQNQNIELPNNIHFIDNFYEQMCSSVRVTLKNERTGTTLAKWVEDKPDHYFHAMNYARIARSKAVVGKALVDYYKSTEQRPRTLSDLERWVRLNGQRLG